MNKLVDHRFMLEPQIGPIEAALYEYVTAADGVYVRARKPGLEVCFNIASATSPIKGLFEIGEAFQMDAPKVPLNLVDSMLKKARVEAIADLEVLFHLAYEGIWHLALPEQTQSAAACRPIGNESANWAQIEVHSHHSMPAFFSATDNNDEQGFKIFAVLGKVLTSPKINVRVGLHGHFWTIPADWVFELPDDLHDQNFHSDEWDEEGA